MLLLFTMFIFSLTLSFSPGPVNMVIISSGAVHGFRKTFSFVSGATIGFTLLLIFICFGFYTAIEKYPVFFRYLNIAGSLFILYLGYKIASSRSDMSLTKTDSPGFVQGFVMQWINPKAWTASASGAAMFSEPSTPVTALVFITVYFFVCYLSLSAWALMGEKVSVLLRSTRQLRTFNVLMGGLLFIRACYMLFLTF